jgi:hypothetical protein
MLFFFLAACALCATGACVEKGAEGWTLVALIGSAVIFLVAVVVLL